MAGRGDLSTGGRCFGVLMGMVLGTALWSAPLAAGPRDQVKRIFVGLTGTSPTRGDVDALVETLAVGGGAAVADRVIAEYPEFYTVTLKTFATPWTNRDGAVLQPLNDNAYLFRNPRIVSPQTNVLVRDIRIQVNGVASAEDATFSRINQVAGTGGEILMRRGLVALKDRGVSEDRFSVTFQTLQPTTAEETPPDSDIPLVVENRPCLAYDQFVNSVMPILKRLTLMRQDQYARYLQTYPLNADGTDASKPTLYTCTGCHNAEHALFRMTEFDDQALCSQALSRVDFGNLERSILLRGINGSYGHPQLQFVRDVTLNADGTYPAQQVDGTPVVDEDGVPAIGGRLIGRLATYQAGEDALSTAGLTPELGRFVRSFAGRYRRLQIRRDQSGAPLADGMGGYQYDILAPTDASFANSSAYLFEVTPGGDENFERLRARYRQTVIEWMAAERAAYDAQ